MPRAGLTAQRVVEEGERLADELGLADLTLAAVASALGVRQPSLYKHLGGLDELRRHVAVRAKAELADVLARAAVGKSRGDAVVALAAAYRDWAHQHPGRYEASLRAPDQDDPDDERASSAALGVVLVVLSGFVLSGEEGIDAARALRSALHGFVSLEAAGGFGLPRDLDRSYDCLVEGYVAALQARST